MEKSEKKRIHKILQRRTEQLAAISDSTATEIKSVSTVEIVSGEEIFALPTDYLREIVDDPGVVALPGLPLWVAGVTQIRGEIVAVVDLAAWFAIETREDEHILAIMENRKDKDQAVLAIRVGSVKGFRAILENEIGKQSENESASGRPVKGVTSDGVSILDLSALLGNCRQELALWREVR